MKLICSSIQRGEIEPYKRMFFNSPLHNLFGENKVSCSWCIEDRCRWYKGCTIGHLSTHDVSLCYKWKTYYEIS